VASSKTKTTTDTEKPAAPPGPSFGMCEGVRADLEQVGETVDPFTGQLVTRED
jgi:hypothetical protein